jgi:outer membrane receptor protein involved in Fe transport
VRATAKAKLRYERSVLDFPLTYQSDAKWAIEGYVTNATDKTYVYELTAPGRPGIPAISYGPPREYGGRLTYRF